MKRKIAFYSHVIDFAGTWRAHERIIEKLQHDERFEVCVLYARNIENNRLNIARRLLYKCEFIPFDRSLEKTGPEEGYSPLTDDFSRTVERNNIEIIHFARSGYYEWPFNRRVAKTQIETNIFGYRDESGLVDGTIYISKSFGFSDSSSTRLIATPVPGPTEKYHTLSDLRKDFGIEDETLVFGRIGRPDNFTPIAFEAFAKCRKIVKCKYIVIGGCDYSRKAVRSLEADDDVIFLDCTNDDEYIERFHKTIDVFAHYRSDGEICSSSLAHAMMYKIPIITHFAGRNGQAEWLGPGGACVSNSQEYLSAMLSLSKKDLRERVGDSARTFALQTFDQEVIAKQAASFYLEIANRQ